MAGFGYHLDRFGRDPALAAGLLEMGEYPLDPERDPSELAAYTAIASLILNLDETITRE